MVPGEATIFLSPFPEPQGGLLYSFYSTVFIVPVREGESRMAKKSILTLLLCSLLVAVSPADARTRPTHAAGSDNEPLQAQSLLGATPAVGESISVNVGTETFVFGITKEVAIKEMGYLLSARSKSALVAKPCEGGSLFANKVMPYLQNSKEMQDSLKVRRMARQIRYQIMAQSVKNDKTADPKLVDALMKFYAMSVNSPLVVLDKSPLPEFIREPGAGPCMMPIGVVAQDEKGEPVALETSVLCITDLGEEGKKPMLSISEAVDNDTLDIILGHENAHAIQYDMYGPAWYSIKRISNNGHDTPYITDQAMGLIEGWAEAFEAVYGPNTIQFKDKDRAKWGISEFLYDRQDPIRRERYVWGDPKKRTGKMKNAAQLMACEGVIAGLFYDILTSRAINAPLEKSLTVFFAAKPDSFVPFARAWLKFFPDDRNVMSRIILENVNYVTMNNEAAKLYQAYYSAKLAYVQKTGTKEAHDTAKAAFTSFKEGLFKKAAAGEDLFGNVGPDMWFEGFWKSNKPHEEEVLSKIQVARREAKKQLGIPLGDDDVGGWQFHLNLNTVSPKTLAFIGFDAEDAKKIVEARNAKGFLTGDPMKAFAAIVGAEKMKGYTTKMKLETLTLEEKKKETAAKQTKILWPEDCEKLYKGADL